MNSFKKALFASALFAATVSAAHAQGVVYSENFEGYAVGDSITGQDNFTTNDPENTGAETPATQVGGLNSVVDGMGPLDPTNAGQLLGGYSGGGITGYPGTSPVSLSAPVFLGAGAAGGYSFNTDFLVSSSTTGVNSTYGFSFNTGATPISGASPTSLFSIGFTPDASDVNGSAQLTYTVGGVVTTSTVQAITLDGVYHLSISVSPTGEVSADYYGLSTPGTVQHIATFDATPAALGVTSYSVTQATPGTPSAANYADDNITFDNVTFSVVPEPSTYAMIGLGLMSLVGVMKFRRRSA